MDLFLLLGIVLGHHTLTVLVVYRWLWSEQGGLCEMAGLIVLTACLRVFVYRPYRQRHHPGPETPEEF